MVHFANADLIAAGLSPLRPSNAALHAGRLFLAELDRLSGSNFDFAFESTLSGLAHHARLVQWKKQGYRLESVYLRLDTPAIALKRIAARVREGGHAVPAADVRRRFVRSWRNFEKLYRPLCDAWWLYDATNFPPTLLAKHP